MTASLVARLVLLAVTSTTGPSGDQPAAAVIRRIVEGHDALPALSAVQEAAVKALGIAGVGAASWASRARLRSLVPRVDFRFGTDRDQTIRDGEPGEIAWYRTRDEALGIDFWARWELSELVFHETELRAHRERLQRAAVIYNARDRATELYFRRVEVELKLRSKPTTALHLQAARIDGLICALTGGHLDECEH